MGDEYAAILYEDGRRVGESATDAGITRLGDGRCRWGWLHSVRVGAGIVEIFISVQILGQIRACSLQTRLLGVFLCPEYRAGFALHITLGAYQRGAAINDS